MKNNRTSIRIFLAAFLFVLLFTIPSCAQTIAESIDFEEASSDDVVQEIHDPYEKWNRKVFSFNDKIYTYVLNPAAKVYNFLVPKFAQKRISNIFTNIEMPKRFFNCIFQKKFKRSAISFSRFTINSTIGIGGMFDPAASFFKLEPQDEDFGQTLGFYGMDEGAYMVLPILGPSTKRDLIGKIGNLAFSPLFWVTVLEVDPDDVFFAARIESGMNSYAYTVYDGYVDFKKNSIEPYASLRDIYIKLRRNKVKK